MLGELSFGQPPQAKKFMADLSPSYMQARTVLRQLQRHVAPLVPPEPSPSPLRPAIYFPPVPKFNSSERALVGAWKNYLKWEESNPLELEEKDKLTLIQRIQGVYRKAVINMRFYGEIWFILFCHHCGHNSTKSSGTCHMCGMLVLENTKKL